MLAADCGGRLAELGTEGAREVAVTGKAEFQRQCREIP